MKLSTILIISILAMAAQAPAGNTSPRFRHVSSGKENPKESAKTYAKKTPDSESLDPDTMRIRTAEEIFSQIPLSSKQKTKLNNTLGPWVFSGYRRPADLSRFEVSLSKEDFARIWRQTGPKDSVLVIKEIAGEDDTWNLADFGGESRRDTIMVMEAVEEPLPLPVMGADATPQWLLDQIEAVRLQNDFMYRMMVANPDCIDYEYWNLPVPPTLPEDDHSFGGFLKRQKLKVEVDDAFIPDSDIEKRHWLHVLNTGVQFSQAYLSKNWYQGGNNYLALLGNFFWDVQLNQVYHPNMMFQSTLSYKLGLNSTEDNQYHKYSISEDLLQYNIKFGYKAAHNWYYSLTGQFKTQILNNYPKDSDVRTASFLTPSNTTVGLGMTYSKQNAKKTLQFNASISPLSYNLKTAIDRDIDHGLFGMSQTQRCDSEFGSNAELTFRWQIWSNVLYYTRLFLFTDYHQAQGDWQNTLEFQFNRFFSTQIYMNLRYDSTVDKSIAPKWEKWMMKEILSVGLSYTFSTKG